MMKHYVVITYPLTIILKGQLWFDECIPFLTAEEKYLVPKHRYIELQQ